MASPATTSISSFISMSIDRNTATVQKPNARGEPRPRAGARHERRLLGVGSSAWFGACAARVGNPLQHAASGKAASVVITGLEIIHTVSAHQIHNAMFLG